MVLLCVLCYILRQDKKTQAHDQEIRSLNCVLKIAFTHLITVLTLTMAQWTIKVTVWPPHILCVRPCVSTTLLELRKHLNSFAQYRVITVNTTVLHENCRDLYSTTVEYSYCTVTILYINSANYGYDTQKVDYEKLNWNENIWNNGSRTG